MFIRDNYSFAKTVHSQKLFIRKNCLFVETVHLQKLFIYGVLSVSLQKL